MKIYFILILFFVFSLNSENSFLDLKPYEESKFESSSYNINKKINKLERTFYDYKDKKKKNIDILLVSLKSNKKEMIYKIKNKNQSIISTKNYQKGYSINELIDNYILKNNKQEIKLKSQNGIFNFVILSIKD